MGCGISRSRSNAPSPIQLRLKSRELTITPGTFVRFSSMEKLHDYSFIKKLGSGAFSDVILCSHNPTGTKRALKIVHKSGLTNQHKDTKYMLKEIQILKMLDHPNIIKCFEIFEDERKFYIATEYCPGGDLFGQIIKIKSFTEAIAAQIVFQLLSSLSYCHEKNIVHRDLKPENILILRENKNLIVKVADFGNSCIMDPETRLSGCFGSSYYLAPEVIESSYDDKSDMWSVGIITYILLTGNPPYKGKDNASIIKQVKASPFILTDDKVQGLSLDSVDFHNRLLSIDSSLRISASDAISHPWISQYRDHKGESINLTLENLKQFNCQSKLKEAVHIFLASQIIGNEELKEIRKNFQALDKDGNGKITKSELMEEYCKVMEFKEADKLVDSILMKLDQDNDGNIDYTEFLVSCGENLKKISSNNLKVAFNLFDLDGNGCITAEEIRSVLENGQIADENTWKEMLQEADKNGDGCIDFKEFVEFMNSIKL
jgi:calcium-dependent protein kinase